MSLAPDNTTLTISVGIGDRDQTLYFEVPANAWDVQEHGVEVEVTVDEQRDEDSCRVAEARLEHTPSPERVDT